MSACTVRLFYAAAAAVAEAVAVAFVIMVVCRRHRCCRYVRHFFQSIALPLSLSLYLFIFLSTILALATHAAFYRDSISKFSATRKPTTQPTTEPAATYQF